MACRCPLLLPQPLPSAAADCRCRCLPPTALTALTLHRALLQPAAAVAAAAQDCAECADRAEPAPLSGCSYFLLSSLCSGLLGGIMYFCAAAAPTKQLVLLGLGLGTSLLSLLVVEPLVSRQMLERYEMENAFFRDEGAVVWSVGWVGGWGAEGSPVPAGRARCCC